MTQTEHLTGGVSGQSALAKIIRSSSPGNTVRGSSDHCIKRTCGEPKSGGGREDMAISSGSADGSQRSEILSIELPIDTLRLAGGLLSQQGAGSVAFDEQVLGALVDKCIRLYETLWRMQSDGASFYVDNIRAPMGEDEVQAQRSMFRARARTNRRVLLPFQVR
jgi:hypothetical protein